MLTSDQPIAHAQATDWIFGCRLNMSRLFERFSTWWLYLTGSWLEQDEPGWNESDGWMCQFHAHGTTDDTHFFFKPCSIGLMSICPSPIKRSIGGRISRQIEFLPSMLIAGYSISHILSGFTDSYLQTWFYLIHPWHARKLHARIAPNAMLCLENTKTNETFQVQTLRLVW